MTLSSTSQINNSDPKPKRARRTTSHSDDSSIVLMISSHGEILTDQPIQLENVYWQSFRPRMGAVHFTHPSSHFNTSYNMTQWYNQLKTGEPDAVQHNGHLRSLSHYCNIIQDNQAAKMMGSSRGLVEAPLRTLLRHIEKISYTFAMHESKTNFKFADIGTEPDILQIIS
jgi:hypothetical protein